MASTQGQHSHNLIMMTTLIKWGYVRKKNSVAWGVQSVSLWDAVWRFQVGMVHTLEFWVGSMSHRDQV